LDDAVDDAVDAAAAAGIPTYFDLRRPPDPGRPQPGGESEQGRRRDPRAPRAPAPRQARPVLLRAHARPAVQRALRADAYEDGTGREADRRGARRVPRGVAQEVGGGGPGLRADGAGVAAGDGAWGVGEDDDGVCGVHVFVQSGTSNPVRAPHRVPAMSGCPAFLKLTGALFVPLNPVTRN
jgi:hypothetical protein